MRALDLFCGGFGAGWGYALAGFEVTGVDFVQRRDVPPGVAYVKADVLRSFDLIHASPPCKVHTRLQSGCQRPMCGHRIAGDRPFGLYGTLNDQVPDGGQTPETLAQARELIGMPWASWAAITQAIPPAYTRHLGESAMREIGVPA